MSADQRLVRVASRMLWPAREAPGFAPPAEEEFKELLRALAANKVPLLSLDRDFAPMERFYASAGFQQVLAGEQAQFAGLRSEYRPVHQALDSVGIRDVLIKAAGIAPSFPYKSDNLDVLVSLADGPRAKEILWDLGYVELRNVEEPRKYLFRKFHGGASVSAIHLHESIGWGTGFMDDEGVLQRARRAPDDVDLLVPGPEDALLVTMAHAFYEDKAVSLGDLWKVTYILRQGELDWQLLLGQAARRGWQEGLDACIWLWAELERQCYGEHSFPLEVVRQAQVRSPAYSHRHLRSCLENGSVAFPFRISFGFSKQHYYRKVLRDAALKPWEKAWDILRHSWAGVRRRLPVRIQRCMLITLSGIDGSGKTAQAGLLRGAFQQCDIEARVAWRRGGSSRLMDLVVRLVKPLLGRGSRIDITSDTREAKVTRKGIWLRRPLLRWGWTWLVVADLLLGYLPAVWWPLVRGRVIISDRYTYDALVELAVLTGDLEAARSLPARALRALSPRPQMAYLLDVAPDVAHARKPDETLQFLEAQAAAYRELGRAWGMRLIDANGGLAACADELVRGVLGGYYRQWRGPRRGAEAARREAGPGAGGD